MYQSELAFISESPPPGVRPGQGEGAVPPRPEPGVFPDEGEAAAAKAQPAVPAGAHVEQLHLGFGQVTS